MVASQKEDIVASLIILRKMNDLPGSADGATLHTVDDDIFVADEMEQPLSMAQTGAAPLVPLTSCMGAPLALPTQTPTV